MNAHDPDSRAWVDALASDDERERRRATGRLQSLVARAVRDDLRRRHELDPADLPDIAADAGGSAFERLSGSLGEYDGSSRFTVYAASFAFAELARTLGGARAPGCEDCLAGMAEHVEVELVGGDPALALPEVERHLAACEPCASARAGLHEFALRRG